MRTRAAVLHEAHAPLVVEEVDLAPPGPGEVLVRVASAGVCHSDLHLAEGHLGPRWPIVLGHEGAGVVEEVGAGVYVLRPGDRVGFCHIAPCGECRACRGGRPALCEASGRAAYAGSLQDGSTRLRRGDGTPLLHFNFVSCFAEHAVMPASCAVPLPAELPLWQAALIGCGAVTGFGAVRNAARVQPADRVAVIGCGGVGLQVVAAARLAQAETLVAVDRDEAKLELALARGATHAVRAGDDAAARIRELTGGGVDYAFEVVGRPETILLAWEALAPGGTAVVVGIVPKGTEVPLPAFDLISEKALRGSAYGSGEPAVELRLLAELAAEGRLDVGDVVSHTCDLEGIEEAFERLRRGEGARTVVLLDGEPGPEHLPGP
jgi:S-(hydroxymethyl)glutathione dehydrogenase/alcohol dehydrogenase